MDQQVFVLGFTVIFGIFVIFALSRLFTIASLQKKILEELRIANKREHLTQQEKVAARFKGVHASD